MSKARTEKVRSAARGQWLQILPAICNFSADILDGRAHACPKLCDPDSGGKDRFRMVDQEAGAVYCNQCFSKGCGDGFATVAWWAGCNFPEAVERVAEYLGIAKSARGRRPAPDANLEFMPDNRALLAIWSTRKPGVTIEALEACGAKLARYRGQFTVVAIPVFGQKGTQAKPVGWVIFNYSGGQLPAFKGKEGEVEWVDSKVTFGSKPGMVGLAGLKLMESGQASEAWKVEGVTDLLAATAAANGSTAIVCNSAGAKESPKWQAKLFADLPARVVGDADRTGLEGAEIWSKAIASYAAECRRVDLPYPVEAKKGKDVRFFLQSGTWDDLQQIAASSPLVAAGKAAIEPLSNATEGDDPNPLQMVELVERILGRTSGWPKQIDGALFAPAEGQNVRWLTRPASLFAWLSNYGHVDWHERRRGFVSKAEFHDELTAVAEKFESIEYFPHFPKMPQIFYHCQDPQPGDGSALEELLSRFRPETPADLELIRAMIVTLFWGGQPGQRPAFLITADGRGSGKTKLAQIVASLAGGAFDVSSRDDPEHIKARLLTPEAAHKRVALLDNIKSHRFSWAEFESLITADVISGKRMYRGEASRPNLITWLLTLNGASLSTDVAQRCIVVRLARSANRATWEDETRQFVAQHGEAVLADLAGFFQRPQAAMKNYSRWAAWDHAVLSRLECPDALLEVIKLRQQETDTEADEAASFAEFIDHQLQKAGFDLLDDEGGLGPDAELPIHIPNKIMAVWWNEHAGTRDATRTIHQRLEQMIREGQIENLKKNPSRTHGRGWLRAQKSAHHNIWNGTQTDYSLQSKLGSQFNR